MNKVDLYYAGGGHQAPGWYKIKESNVKNLLKTPGWSRSESAKEELKVVEKEKPIVEEEVKKVPTKYWTEKEIYNWIKENNIDINYNISRDTKKWVIEELKKSENKTNL